MNETDFTKRLLNNQIKTPKKFKIIENELRLYCLDNNKQIGRVDLFFSTGVKNYIAEIKCMNGGSFFYATKVLAYLKYGKYTGQISKDTLAAVIIPFEEIRQEYVIIASKLNITIFVIKQDEEQVSLYKY